MASGRFGVAATRINRATAAGPQRRDLAAAIRLVAWRDASMGTVQMTREQAVSIIQEQCTDVSSDAGLPAFHWNPPRDFLSF
jgi:hypothetical protein